MLEQRFYSSDDGDYIDSVDGNVYHGALIVADPVAHRGFTTRGGTPVVFLIVADEAEWDDFDVRHPNQSVTSGHPFQRRYPKNDLPYLAVSE